MYHKVEKRGEKIWTHRAMDGVNNSVRNKQRDRD